MFTFMNCAYVLASYLVEHPDVIICKWERGAYTYYRFDSVACCIKYRRPSNKRYNDWRIADGLMWYLRYGEIHKEVFE